MEKTIKVIIGIVLGIFIVLFCLSMLIKTDVQYFVMDLINSNENVRNEQAKQEYEEATKVAKGKAKEKTEKEKLAEKLEWDEKAGLFILVNKEHPLDKDYKPYPISHLENVAKNRLSSDQFMIKEAAEAFDAMTNDAKNIDKIEIVATTAFRTYDRQKQLYDSYVANHGEAQATRFSAKPGSSEHQTGLAVDVTTPSINYELSQDFEVTKAFKWLSENAYKYGFILRFPKGKEEITGYMYEPWHYRYVGLNAAKEITLKEITFEEFVENREKEKTK